MVIIQHSTFEAVARMVSNGLHDDMDSPPDIPAFHGNTKCSHNLTKQPGAKQHTFRNCQSNSRYVSPGKAVEVWMKTQRCKQQYPK